MSRVTEAGMDGASEEDVQRVEQRAVGLSDERWIWLGLTEGMTVAELPDLADQQEMIEPMTVDSIGQRELAEQLLERAREQNIELVGPDGLLGQLTKSVLETALDAEMSERLGYERHDRVERQQRQQPQRYTRQDGADGDRSGRDRGPEGHRVNIRAADRQEAPAAAYRGR